MINKLILTILACSLTLFSYAQDAEANYKPTAGDKTFEVGINLNAGTFLQNGEIRLRSFIRDQVAVRYGASVSYNYDKLSEDASASDLTLSFAPGIEKHFAGTEKLSPYIGVSVPLTWNHKQSESAYAEVKNGRLHGSDYIDKAFISFGLNGLAGVDFYFAPKFYAGFEAGIGFSYFKFKDAEIDYKQNSWENRVEEGYHRLRLSPFTTGGIRLGFVF